jgi:hypothetical protein
MNRLHLFAVAALAAGCCLPAHAERPCSVTLAMPAAQSVTKAAGPAMVALSAKSGSPFGKGTMALVAGRGKAVLTDFDGEKFLHQFSIAAEVTNDGAARGRASFVFPMPFSQKWGAVPGVDLIHLEGEITAGSVDDQGKVSLAGPFVERDYSRSDGLVYEEDSRESGATPLAIVVSPKSREFTFSWCDFIPPDGTGHFSSVITGGNLNVQTFATKTRPHAGHAH